MKKLKRRGGGGVRGSRGLRTTFPRRILVPEAMWVDKGREGPQNVKNWGGIVYG